VTGVPLSLLMTAIQPIGGHGGWHGGPTPLGAVRGVAAEQAHWSPTPRRKSIWALTLHIAYWKYAVRRLLEGSARGVFPRRPSNWPSPPVRADTRGWKDDVALLRHEHQRLLQAAQAVEPRLLPRRPPGARRWTYGDLLVGIAAHDAYHTGQIQLLKRLWQERSRLGRNR
jgi:uncharacterized damage-inducible protein DinB